MRRKLRLTRYQEDESIMVYRPNIIHTEQVIVDGEHGRKIPALNIWWIEI